MKLHEDEQWRDRLFYDKTDAERISRQAYWTGFIIGGIVMFATMALIGITVG